MLSAWCPLAASEPPCLSAQDVILPPSQEWNRAFGGIFKEARKELPLGMALVKGWLETGFLGWLPEFGVIFIWDQLALLGGTPSQNQRFVARLCAQLLKLLRDPLLESTRMFASVIRKAGRLLRSKVLYCSYWLSFCNLL